MISIEPHPHAHLLLKERFLHKVHARADKDQVTARGYQASLSADKAVQAFHYGAQTQQALHTGLNTACAGYCSNLCMCMSKRWLVLLPLASGVNDCYCQC